jgi:DeoR family suf operon transcriptional repressor
MAAADTTASPTQRRVLAALKRHGEATADELADTLQISASAVRQHLAALRAADLIEPRRDSATPRGSQRGRPADRYRATERTETMFVGGDDLSIELLAHIEQEDPELVSRVFDRRRRQLVDEARDHLDGDTIEARIAQVTELMDAQGYLCDFEQVASGHYRINLHNCAIWSVARRFRQACASELEFLQGVLPDADVERITHKTAGAHTCAYAIRIVA